MSIDKDDANYNSSYLNAKAVKIIHDSDIDNVLESANSTTLTKIRKYQVEGSDWTIDSVIQRKY